MLTDLAKRCVELSYRHKLTHVSSVLNVVDLISEIYAKMQPPDVFVLGAGHASLAHFVVLESLGKCDAEEMLHRHGVHSSRDVEHGIMCSNGSLGQAETVALGMALADRRRMVWLVTSDGSCAEGSVWEAARVGFHRAPNLSAWIVYNGLGAYGPIRTQDLPTQYGWRLKHVDQTKYPHWLRGLNGHYLTLSLAQYDELMHP